LFDLTNVILKLIMFKFRRTKARVPWMIDVDVSIRGVRKILILARNLVLASRTKQFKLTVSKWHLPYVKSLSASVILKPVEVSVVIILYMYRYLYVYLYIFFFFFFLDHRPKPVMSCYNRCRNNVLFHLAYSLISRKVHLLVI